jgi:hypothetical protein
VGRDENDGESPSGARWSARRVIATALPSPQGRPICGKAFRDVVACQVLEMNGRGASERDGPGDARPMSMSGTSQHPPSLLPTVAKVSARPPRSNGWAAIAIVSGALLIAAPTLLRSREVSKASAAPSVVLKLASIPNAPLAPSPSASCAAVDAPGAQQFIELDETLIVGTVDPGGGPPLAGPIDGDRLAARASRPELRR